AQWLQDHPAVRRVHYPGLPSHPDHEIAKATMEGFGGMLAFELDSTASAERFLARLNLVFHSSGLGGVDSLACEPRVSSHSRLTSEEREEIGIPDGFIRLSVGIEGVTDIIADLQQALSA
ncbi:MAG: PLP-dependent transferase, partial [Gemmatimonadaceae bacterium]